MLDANGVASRYVGSRRGSDRDAVVPGDIGDKIDVLLAVAPDFVVKFSDGVASPVACLDNDVGATLFDDHVNALARLHHDEVPMIVVPCQLALDGAALLE